MLAPSFIPYVWWLTSKNNGEFFGIRAIFAGGNASVVSLFL